MFSPDKNTRHDTDPRPSKDSNLLQDVDRVGELAVHDAHLPPDLPNVFLHLAGEGVEGVRLVGEDGPRDRLELGSQIVVHLSSRKLDELRDLRGTFKVSFSSNSWPENAAHHHCLTLKIIC